MTDFDFGGTFCRIQKRITGIPQFVAERTGSAKLMLVTDENVYGLFGEKLLYGLSEQFDTSVFTVKPGEQAKTADNLFSLWSALAENGFDRGSCVAALGGGTVTDLAGFAASTYMRGIRLVNIPTSLLGMVDASAGGKTGINLSEGKNLAGTFFPADAIICCTDFLSTLPRSEIRNGYAEIIKYSFLGADGILSASSPDEKVEISLKTKYRYTENDLRDNGGRRFLNLGHTFAHAIEKLSDFEIPHGEAVAKGLYLITRASVKNGLCDASVSAELLKTLDEYRFDTDIPFSLGDLCDAASGDKKTKNGNLTLVLPVARNSCTLYEIPAAELYDFVKE